jgi:predicted nucleic acid-binding protein
VIYFDTTYVFRLYFQDPGWEAVEKLAASDRVASCFHGRAETLGTFHRKLREGALAPGDFKSLLGDFHRDCAAGAFSWLPLTESVLDRVRLAYRTLPANVHLRSGDAIHLACAAEHNFTKIYSNDTRLLSSAQYFGLAGENVI